MKRLFSVLSLLLLLACSQNDAPHSEPSPTPQPPRYTVILDFGHGGFDGGAVGTETGVVEADLNLAIGRLVMDALQEGGCEIVLTRTDENALGETKNADMHARGEILKQDADCTVSIHMNKFSDRRIFGPMAFYQAGSDEGQRLAQCVIDALTDALEKPERLANPADNFVTRVPAAPSVLVECGFLSNAKEELALQDAAYQKNLADAIARGVLRYLNSRATETDGTDTRCCRTDRAPLRRTDRYSS